MMSRELTAHVGFGLHPGFGATSFDSFRFEMPAGLYRRHFSPNNYLSGETEEIQFAGGEMPFPKEKLPGSYILELVDVPDRTFTYFDPPTGRESSLRSDRGSLSNVVVGWRDLPLRRAVLGFDRSPRATCLRRKRGNSKDCPGRGTRCRIFDRAATGNCALLITAAERRAHASSRVARRRGTSPTANSSRSSRTDADRRAQRRNLTWSRISACGVPRRASPASG